MAKPKSNLLSFGLIPLAAAIAGFAIASALSVVLLQATVNSDHRQALAEMIASELAQQVNIKEAQFSAQLAKIAASPMVLKAIEGSNADVLGAESQIAAVLPFAERVRLIKEGTARRDESYPPFNFAAKDLVNNVEAGQTTIPEVISSRPQLSGDLWVIAATAVKSADGKLKGTLFVYLQNTVLSQAISDGSKGSIRILQKAGNDPKPIATTGSNGAGPIYTVQLNNANWSLEYTPTPDIAGSAPANLLLFILPAVIMLLVAAGGIVFGALQAGKNMQTNLQILGKQISKVATGTYDIEAEYSLPGFEDQDSKLFQLTMTKQGKARAQQAIAEEPADKPIEAVDQKITPEATSASVVAEAEVEEIEVDDFDEAVEAANADEDAIVQDLTDTSSIAHIFRAYDIRGIVGESLSEDIARDIGLAVGSEAEARGEQTLVVGYDGREYSPALAEALIEGICSSGRDVINIGAVPTPVVYYATHNTEATSAVMVTGSHNPPDYNGFKIVLGQKTLVADDIQDLHRRIQEGDFSTGRGDVSELNINQDYMDAIADDVVVAQPLKVVLDCGNGIAGAIAPELMDALGCEAVPLYCEVDGSFPNHHPDPTKPENMEDLILTVQSQGADLGIGFDGDGDRMVAVTAEGDIVWPDRMLMLFAKDIVARNPGSDVVYDVKCTRHLNSVISGFGGRPIMSRSGHSYLKEKMQETGAMIGGELSGHICFQERWFGFDDGLYSAARLLEIVGSQEEGLADLMREFPVSVNTPEIHIAVEEEGKFELIEKLVDTADFEDASITTIDGLRVDFSDGWGLIRASNTEPALTLRFEADNDEALDDIKGAFRELLQEVRPDLDFT